MYFIYVQILHKRILILPVFKVIAYLRLSVKSCCCFLVLGLTNYFLDFIKAVALILFLNCNPFSTAIIK